MASRLRDFLSRPVAWGAVILSYVGIFVGFGFAVWTYAAVTDEIAAESARADAAVVMTGRRAIRSGCVFDNQRARELRSILQRSIKNQKVLIARGAIDPKLGARNLRITRESLNSISFRNCKAAANVLTAHPKGAK